MDSFISLSITEEMLLLSLDDEKGKLIYCDSNVLRFVLAGGVLFDLLIQKEIEIEKDEVVSWPKDLTGNPVLDLAIERMAKKNHIKKLNYWIRQLARDYGKVKPILLEKLVALGAVKKEAHTFLRAFSYNRYPTDNARIEDRIRLRIRDSLFGDDAIDPRGFIILTLIGAAKLEAEVFGEDLAKESRHRIASVTAEDEIGLAITSTVLDLESAL